MSLMFRSKASFTCFSVNSMRLTMPTPKPSNAKLRAVCKGLAFKFCHAWYKRPNLMCLGVEG